MLCTQKHYFTLKKHSLNNIKLINNNIITSKGPHLHVLFYYFYNLLRDFPPN